jgi:transposase-like protein
VTVRYGDTCPACASTDVTPYAVIIGGSEEYGYQCQACQVSWPVLTHAETLPAIQPVGLRGSRPAVRTA